MKIFAGIAAVICVGAGLVVALSGGGDTPPVLGGNALQVAASDSGSDSVSSSSAAPSDDFDDTIRVDTKLPEPKRESEVIDMTFDVTTITAVPEEAVITAAPVEVLNGYVPIGEDCSLSLDPIRELLVKRDANMLNAEDVVRLQALLNEASGVVCSGDEWVTFQENELVPVDPETGQAPEVQDAPAS